MRRKFSDQDKEAIAQQYRDPDMTIASLADHYLVSVSTMQRLLKEAFSPEDYAAITASKRNRKKNNTLDLEPDTLPLLVEDIPEPLAPIFLAPETVPEIDTEFDTEISPKHHSESSPESSSEGVRELTPAIPIEIESEPRFGEILTYTPPPSELFFERDEEDNDPEEVDPDLAAALQVEFQGYPMVGDSDLSDLDEDEEIEDEDEDDDDADGNGSPIDPASEDVSTLEVLSLDDLDPPSKCYAVIDRFQELATRPLKDFDHAGILPTHLHQLRTLPLFDNHRVARRFSDVIRRGSSPGYRVIDFPGEWLFMVRTSLWERGITHVLLDGHIYDLQEPAPIGDPG